MSKKLVGLVLAFALLLAVYYSLGGFAPVVIELNDCQDIRLVGLHFEGTPQDERLAGSFHRIEALIAENPANFLHTIYYEEPAGKRDTLHLFVGTEFLPDSKGFDLVEVPCTKIVVAEIQAHRFVMPSPLNVKKKIRAFADENGLKLADIFIDRLIGSDRVQVWAPLAIAD